MKIDEIKERISYIESQKYDDEVAHSEEDDLFYDFVTAIIERKYKSRKDIIIAAEELIKVRDIDFARWHA